jgi:hypothetical protein
MNINKMNESVEVGSEVGMQTLEKNEPEIQTPEEVALIDGTIEEIKSIFNNGVTDTYIKIGTLIVERIYKDKIEDIDFSKGPKKRDKQKHLLFKTLAEEIYKRAEKGETLPQKTWLYNSVRLVKDSQLLQDCKGYNEISISHKIALLQLTKKSDKVDAVNEILQNNLSVRSVRELLDKKPVPDKNDIVCH